MSSLKSLQFIPALLLSFHSGIETAVRAMAKQALVDLIPMPGMWRCSLQASTVLKYHNLIPDLLVLLPSWRYARLKSSLEAQRS